MVSLSDGHRKTVVRGGSWARVLPSGYLIFINSGSLFAVRFDLKTLEVYGTPKPVLHSVRVSPVWGSAQIDVSRDGTLVYRAGKTDAGLVTIQWLDESGNHRPLVPFPGNYLSPTLSPDGKRLALISSGDIWVYDLQRAVMVRLSFGGGCGNPIWTADGRHVLFRAADGIFWTGADAATEPRPLLHGSSSLFPWSLTADGKRLFYVQINATTGADIWTVKLDSTGGGLHAGAAEVFQQTHFDERSPMISPDGRWMAYASNASGTLQVYVENFPAKRAAVQISTGGGAYPAWSPAAHKLFFWNTRTDQVMVAEYSAHGESFVAHTPRAWSQAHLSVFGTTRTYDPAPDAKRIVALMPAENPAPFQNQLIFFLNFFDELRRQLP